MYRLKMYGDYTRFGDYGDYGDPGIGSWFKSHVVDPFKRGFRIGTAPLRLIHKIPGVSLVEKLAPGPAGAILRGAGSISQGGGASITAPIGSSPVGTIHGPPALGPGTAMVRGHHPSKRHLAALARGLTRAPPRMNPYNPHALGRAGRRIGSFLKHARKFMRFVGTHPKGRAVFKLKRRRK